MKKPQRHNPVIINFNTDIGNPAAEEDDDFLFECFVDNPAYASAIEAGGPKVFISGRTGSGKTAILRMIEKQNPHYATSIDLPSIALDYVANSDIIRFLNSINIDLDLFFQALWKHVLCIEYIRMKFDVNNERESKTIFDRLYEYFTTDSRKRKALDYLKNWESKFWITMDVTIKEITNSLEQKIDAELSTEIEYFKTRAGYSRQLSQEKRLQIQARAKKVVNSELLSELGRVIELLSEYPDGKYAHINYLLIDKLDEKWVDESIRYSLIRALIESVKAFRKIPKLKLAISIRSDVLERVIQENKDVGFQREKYDSYFDRVRWDKPSLRRLVEKRINFLFKRKYTSENVHFNDVFRHTVGGKEPFEYMIERTLYRPRDIISFINICLENAKGKSEVQANIIKQSESEYSRVRLQALIQEWKSAFPSLEVAFNLLQNRRGRFSASELSNKEFIEDFILNVSDLKNTSNDPIYNLANDYMRDGSETRLLLVGQRLLSELYRIGAIGLKLSSGERFIYSYRDVPVVLPESIDKETKIHIHPMLHRALNVQDGRKQYF